MNYANLGADRGNSKWYLVLIPNRDPKGLFFYEPLRRNDMNWSSEIAQGNSIYLKTDVMSVQALGGYN